VSAKGIYLANDLPLGYAAHGRVTRHLRYLVHIHRDKQRPRSHLGRSTGGLAPGVPGAHHHDIVPLLHLFQFYFPANVVIFRETSFLSAQLFDSTPSTNRDAPLYFFMLFIGEVGNKH